MTSRPALYIFGEVLFDCFPGGEQVLGGAPFNVAWHLHALGDQPHFISRVGTDAWGDRILAAMEAWEMDRSWVQRDPQHPTGRVEVEIIDNEPSYQIVPDSAYDFIARDALKTLPPGSILYHGSLALRSEETRAAFARLCQEAKPAIFLDVNLRSPWWQKQDLFTWLQEARWVKLNQDELCQLGFSGADLNQQMAELQNRFDLEQLILTRGAEGALVRTAAGDFHSQPPEKSVKLVDTVGAGDAFSAIYLHGLLADWPVAKTLARAQQFASRVIGLRGATTTEANFYADFNRLLQADD